MSKKEGTARFQIKKVRLSYPSLFKKAKFEGVETKYEATFLIPKTDHQLKEIRRILGDAASAYFGDPLPAKLKWCIQDGDAEDRDGYEGCYSLKAANPDRPNIVGARREQLCEDDNVIYAGCYVNAIIQPWIQDNKWGKRVNCNLYGVQFHSDGEPFSNIPDVSDEFDDIGDPAGKTSGDLDDIPF